MSLAEIKAEITKLSCTDMVELKRFLLRDPLNDPDYLAEMDRRHAEMERGINIVTREEMYRRLRAAGLDV